MSEKQEGRRRVGRKQRGLWQRIADLPPIRLVGGVWRFGHNVDVRFRHTRSPLLAAAIAFYAIICLTPLGILAVIGLQQLVGARDGVAYEALQSLLQQVAPAQAAEIMGQIEGVLETPNPALTGGLGVVSLLWGATRLFETLARALNAVWPDAKPRGFVRRQVVGLLTLVAAGIGLAGYMVVASVLVNVQGWVNSTGVSLGHLKLPYTLPVPMLAVLFAFVSFFLLYKVIPNRSVGNRAAAAGALFATVGWQVSLIVFTWFISLSGRSGSVYGSLTSVVLFALWMHLLGSMTLVGAHVAAELEGAPLPPPIHDEGDAPRQPREDPGDAPPG